MNHYREGEKHEGLGEWPVPIVGDEDIDDFDEPGSDGASRRHVDDIVINDIEDDNDDESIEYVETQKRAAVSAVEPGKPKKRTKTGISRYIDDMAEEDDEEEDDEKMAVARLRLEEEDREMKSEMERQDRRRNQENLFEGEDADVTNVVKSLHERYQRTTQLAHDLDELDEGIPLADGASAGLAAARHAAARQSNTPSLTDPRLWIVPCKTGCEREAVLSLMNKCIATTREGKSMGICGAMVTGLRGFIYVESRSEPAARAAIKGLRLLRGWSMKMVPMGDMVAVASTDLDAAGSNGAKRKHMRVGDWARVSRDKYRGDLCRIVSLGDSGSSAVIMLVPRVDVSSNSVAEIIGTGRKASRNKVRPPMRLFNASEVVAAGGDVTQRRFRYNGNAGGASRNWAFSDETFDIFENGSYLGGFLYKEINVATMLQRGNANPTLDELQRFVVDDLEEGSGYSYDDDDSTNAKRATAKKHQCSLLMQIEQLAQGSGGSGQNNAELTKGLAVFARNDKVEAIDGEMQGVVFVVERVESAGGVVYCKAIDEPRLQGVLVPMEPRRLIKSIPVGGHVKVGDGKYAGQTGVVLERGELDGDHVAVLLTDCGGREITVRLVHVHESGEISKGLDALEGYELHDLVLLPLGVVGVVAHVATDDLEVLTSRGDLLIVRPAEIARKLNQESARNVSLDSKDEHVRETDHVILDEGHDTGTLATVVRAHRASLWLLKTASGAVSAPRGGLLVCKARQVHVAGDRASGNTLADTYMGLGKQRIVNEDQFNDKGADSRGRGRGVRGACDPFVGRTVRICKGNYKGLAGIVTTATSTHVTVELHTRNRSVTQPRDRVKVVTGAAGGEPELAVQRRIAEQAAYNADLVSTPFLTQATPLLVGATPQYGAATPRATPSRGAATPTWGSATPAYGSQTPHYGSQTPRHGGSMTPGRGNATPCHGGTMTPSHYGGLDDVWRPRVFASPGHNASRSPVHYATSPSHSNFLGLSDRKSPAVGGSRAGTPTHYPPIIPAASKNDVWCVQGVEANLDDGNVCKVTNVQNNTAVVILKNAQAMTRSLPISALIRAEPEAGNKVRVVDGGNIYDAELLSIEESDGIIKLDNGEYKIIDFSAIAKLACF